MTKKLFIISGLSGAGKDSVIEGLKKSGAEFNWVVTTTTRPMRQGETEGNPYHFISKEDFEEKIKNGGFLEWAKVYDNYYGTQKKDVEFLLESGKPTILKIDCQGAKIVKDKIKEVKVIFIVPPSMEILEQRLRGRGTDSEDAIQKRLSVAREEMETIKEWDFVVVNEEGKLDETVEKTKKIIFS